MKSMVITCLVLSLAAPALDHPVLAALAAAQAPTVDLRVAQRFDGLGEQARIMTAQVTLADQSMTVRQALDLVARSSGLPLWYSADVIPLARAVRFPAATLSLAQILEYAAEAADAEIRVSAPRNLILVPAPPPVRIEDARQDSIIGTVRDSESRARVSNVEVTLRELRLTTVTDEQGNYFFPGIPPGRYTLSIRHIGYASTTLTVTLMAGETARLDFDIAARALPLQQLVVTGQVVATAAREVATPVHVVTAEEIEARGITSIEQLMSGIVPGVTALAASGVETDGSVRMMVRGATDMFNPDRSQPLKTYIDGVPMENYNFIGLIDPAMIERIEITRGPQASTIYGSEAMAGVMQIFTKRGQPGRPRINASLGLGTIESAYRDGTAVRHEHRVSASGASGNAFTYNIGGTYRYTGAAMSGYFVDNRSVFTGMRLQEGPVTADLSVRVNRREHGGSGLNQYRQERVLSGQMRYSNTYFVPDDAFRSSLTNTVGLTVGYLPRAWWQNTMTVGQDTRESQTSRDTPRFLNAADTLLSISRGASLRRSIAYSTTVEPTMGQVRLRLSIGGDYYHYTSQSVSNSRATTISRTITGDAANSFSLNDQFHKGYYAQGRAGLSDALFLTAGVRVDDSPSFGSGYGNATAPKFGAVYTRDFGALSAKVRASYGRALKLPPIDAQEGSISSLIIILPNEDIGPELQSGGDFGVDLFWGRKASLEITYYDQTADDLLLLPTLENEPGQPIIRQWENFGQVRNRGVEFTGMVDGSTVGLRGIGLRWNYTRMSGIVQRVNPTARVPADVGDQLNHVPTHSGGLTLSYTHGGINVMTTRTFVGNSWGIDYVQYYDATFARTRSPADAPLGPSVWRARLPGTSQYDLTTRASLSNRVSMALTVNNVLNGRRAAWQNFENALGRTTMVTVNLTPGNP
jgi:outer membrane receptor protein involved in Fe transport